VSLLPQTIPSPSAVLARVWKDGKPTDDGTILEENWWLFLANLAIQVLGAGATNGLPASALVELGGTDSDANDTDAIALRQPISNLRVQVGGLGETEIDAFVLRSGVAKALLLSQDVLLPDPRPAAQPSQAITVGASVYTYTAPFNGTVVVTGGTVSDIAITRQGTSIDTFLNSGVFPVSRGDGVVVTYSGKPTMTFLPT